MHKVLSVAVAQPLLLSFALAQPIVDKGDVEIKDYKANTSPAEKDQALKLKGDVKAGQAAYKAYCEACHLPSGRGNPDGSIPQLAGQHPTVLIKQLADIRSGRRYNPTMYPFARQLADPQALSNVAAYVATLCIPLDSGKYKGSDATKQIADGKGLYEKDCVRCHQPNGEGVADKLYPVLAGQHYAYLLRQMTEIRDGKRVDVPSEMFQAINKYDSSQLVAISAYQASLTTPPSMLSPKGSMCRTGADKGRKAN